MQIVLSIAILLHSILGVSGSAVGAGIYDPQKCSDIAEIFTTAPADPIEVRMPKRSFIWWLMEQSSHVLAVLRTELRPGAGARQDYIDNGSRKLNEYLWRRGVQAVPSEEGFEQQAANLRQAMAKKLLPKGSTVLYSGQRAPPIGVEHFQFHGFLSASIDPLTALKFAKPEGQALYVLRFSEEIPYVLGTVREAERILVDGLWFKVLNRRNDTYYWIGDRLEKIPTIEFEVSRSRIDEP